MYHPKHPCIFVYRYSSIEVIISSPNIIELFSDPNVDTKWESPEVDLKRLFGSDVLGLNDANVTIVEDVITEELNDEIDGFIKNAIG